jgi:hypothetical protein
MQDETPVYLDRPAKIDRKLAHGLVLQGNLDLLEQGAEGHVGRAIHYHPERSLVVVFADERQRREGGGRPC